MSDIGDPHVDPFEVIKNISIEDIDKRDWLERALQDGLTGYEIFLVLTYLGTPEQYNAILNELFSSDE